VFLLSGYREGGGRERETFAKNIVQTSEEAERIVENRGLPGEKSKEEVKPFTNGRRDDVSEIYRAVPKVSSHGGKEALTILNAILIKGRIERHLEL